MEKFGFVGLPNAGKSSLFNALAGGGALAAPYPFATKDPNVGRAKVPDHRLDALAEMSKSKNIVHAACEFMDIGGLVAGASAQVRAWATSSSPASARSTPSSTCCGRSRTTTSWARPTRSSTSTTVETELCLADLATVDNQLPKKEKPPGSTSRSCPRWRPWAPPATCWTRGPRSTGRRYGGAAGAPEAGLPAHQQAGAGRRERGRGRPRTGRRAGQAASSTSWAAPPTCCRCACSSKPRRRMLDESRSGPRCSTPSASARAPCRGSCTPPTTCSASAPSSPRATRRAGPGRSGPAPRPPSAPASSTPTSSGASSAPRSSTGTSCSSSGSWSKARDAGKLRVEGKEYEVVDGDVLEIRFNV